MVIAIVLLILFLIILYCTVKCICHIAAKVLTGLHLNYVLVVLLTLTEMRMLHGGIRFIFAALAAVLFLRVGLHHISELASHDKEDYEYSKEAFKDALAKTFTYFFAVFAFPYIGLSFVPSLLAKGEATSGFLSIVQTYHETNADLYLLTVLSGIAYVQAWKCSADLQISAKPVAIPVRRNELALYFDDVLPELNLPDTVTDSQAKQKLKEYLAKSIEGLSEEIAAQIAEELFFCSLADKREPNEIWEELSEMPNQIAGQLRGKICPQK